MRANRTMATPSPTIVPKKRCAIYTRKSTDEGLDQEYNSLEAQRDAGLAFVASQRHEGWVAVGDGYDDGGYSGGNLDRPGLKRLMADIEAGEVDIVVVYKIDRLTRALSDFAKLVDVFDRNGVSFVSVTQQFNTTTSMGRLTLNILLSFAQFEREVTGERIRDKITTLSSANLSSMPPRPNWCAASSADMPSMVRRRSLCANLPSRAKPRSPGSRRVVCIGRGARSISNTCSPCCATASTLARWCTSDRYGGPTRRTLRGSHRNRAGATLGRIEGQEPDRG